MITKNKVRKNLGLFESITYKKKWAFGIGIAIRYIW